MWNYGILMWNYSIIFHNSAKAICIIQLILNHLPFYTVFGTAFVILSLKPTVSL